MSDITPFIELIKGTVDLGFKVAGSLQKVEAVPNDIPEDISECDTSVSPINADTNLTFNEDIETFETHNLESESLTFAEDADSINEGSYDFNGVDCFKDTERMDSLLDSFQENKWDDLSLEDKKQSMSDLADYVIDVTGNENPPEIIFRDDMGDGEYGGYIPESNTLVINENMLDNSSEAADTVAHELWHAYQQQCAANPNSERGQKYQEGFDNYISSEYDFEGYQNQMVEAEARAFAENFKVRLDSLKGGN
ncbi:hypothetical protein FACS1894188_08150 [Clostridia bacterium]|nr:hypothetical protein FACS1894188_08150 [Clostridia bacterium]